MRKKKKKVPIKIWYTLDECAELSGIGKHEVRTLIHEKKISIEIIKGYFFINKIEFDKYLEL